MTHTHSRTLAHTHAQRAEETVKDNLAATVWQTHTQTASPIHPPEPGRSGSSSQTMFGKRTMEATFIFLARK